jgi:hypothetical protein
MKTGENTMKTKRNKSRGKWGQHLLMVFMMAIGGVCGIYIAKYMDNITESNKSIGEIYFSLALLFVGVYVAALLQIIIHEAGHLLFGRMTGYQFSSFRIGSFLWIKENGAYRLRRLTLAGTGGQCLMAPPEMINGRFPYVLYNMGGSINNFLSVVLFAGAAFLAKDIPIVTTFFMILAVIGVVVGLMNGIPMRLKEVNNDGYNAITLGKDTAALRAFWIQLKCSELSIKGVRIKDMPEEWFEMPSMEAMKNSMIAFLGVFACSRMMEQREFEKAEQTMRELLQGDTGLVGLHRSLMNTELIYCELVGENRSETLADLLSKQQKKFMKAMKNFPSVQRTEYAYALIAEKDTLKAQKIKIAFEKTAKTYPHTGDIANEWELMEYAERCQNV